ncbi:intermembrane phospholipid transport protein YdbH family protein [Oceanobacter kriegii]|uniref:intermembrane phospholipid transport protein YdbH family protein n=1 Tax=Oceanobacter kriegii TaxID=64972 RepID=UPI0004020506|nr:YdbH domain-containing protein [Oceanobacter kriegii]
MLVSMLKGTVMLLALLGLLTLGLVATGIWLFPSLLQRGLNQLPPVVTSVTGVDVDWHISQLDSRQLTLQYARTALADGTAINVQQLQLHYDARGVLNGQLQNLHAERLDIILGSTGDTLVEASAQQRQQQVAAQLQQPWIEIPQLHSLMQLPINQITIDTLALHHPLLDAELLVQMNARQWRIAGDLKPLPAQTDLSWVMEFQLIDGADQSQILGQLRDQQSLLAHWFAAVEQTPAADQTTTQANDRTSTQSSVTKVNGRQVLVVPALQQQLAQLPASAREAIATALELPQWQADDQALWLTALAQLQKVDSQFNAAFPSRFRWPQDAELSSLTTLESSQERPFSLDLSTLLSASQSGQERLNRAQLQLQPLASSRQLLTLGVSHSSDAASSQPWRIHSRFGALQLQFEQPTANGNSNVELSLAQLIDGITLRCSDDFGYCQSQLSTELAYQFNEPAALTAAGKLHWDLRADITPLESLLQATLNSQHRLTMDAVTADIELNSQLAVSLPSDANTPLAVDIRDTQLRLDAQQLPGWNVPTVSLQQRQPLQQHWNLSGSSPQLTSSTPLALMLNPLTLSPDASTIKTTPAHKPTRLNLGASTLECQPSLQTPHCYVSLRLRSSRWQQWPVPDVRLRSEINLDLPDNGISASGQLAAANNQLKSEFRLQHQLDDGQGDAQFHIEDSQLSFSEAGLQSLADLTGTQILAGRLSGQGWINWQLPDDASPTDNSSAENNSATDNKNTLILHPNLMLRVDQLSMVYDNRITTENTNLLMAVRPQPDSYEVTAQLDANSINTGIALSNTMARISMNIGRQQDWVSADIRELSTRLLGGQIYIPAMHYDSRQDTNTLDVAVDNLQLAQLAQLEPSAEVKAEGSLDGALPILLTRDGPMIPHGTLYARSPGGVIRYQTETSAALANTDPAVGLAMQALENFQFNQLETDIRYQPDGALNLGLKFEGHNPDFFDGQATHLNVNLDYNLLDLLESLRVADDLISDLESRYQ